MMECPYAVDNMKFLSMDQWGSAVTINTGEKSFTVHKGLISHYSPYFAAQFSGRWGSKDTIEFKEADQVSFQAFCYFIYANRIASHPTATPLETAQRSRAGRSRKRVVGDTRNVASTNSGTVVAHDAGSYTLMQLCRMYALGNFFLCPAFKCATMDAIIDKLKVNNPTFPSPDAIDFAYTKTCAGSSLRRFFSDWYVLEKYVKSPFLEKAWRERLNKDFLFDVMTGLYLQVNDLEGAVKQVQWAKLRVEKCAYHDHESDAARNKAKPDGQL